MTDELEAGITHAALEGQMPLWAAWLLLAGAVVFWVGAGTPPYKQWMGPPMPEYLAIIGAYPRNWLFINGCFTLGCVLTVPGLALLSGMLRAAGDRGWSQAGLAMFAVGAALWLVHLGHRLVVTPWAAAELSRSGAVPSLYEPIHRWMGLLFALHMVLSYLAMAAFGASLLQTRMLAPWVGWTAVVFGLVAVPGLATPLFQPPLMVHVVPFIVGVAVLRAR